MYCLVVRNEEGNVSSVSAAMPMEKVEEQKGIHRSTGLSEDQMSVVSKEVGRKLKRKMTTHR